MICVVTLFLVGCTNNAASQTFPGDLITNANLTKREATGYEFFYPNYYKEADDEVQDFAYANATANSIGGSNNLGLTIQTSENKGTKPKNDECKTMIDTLASSLGGAAESDKILNEGGMSGCYGKINATLFDAKLVIETRVLWKTDVEQASSYKVNITYEAGTKAEEIKDLQDTLAKFKIL